VRNRRRKAFAFIGTPPLKGADAKNGAAGERQARHTDAKGLSAQAVGLWTGKRDFSGKSRFEGRLTGLLRSGPTG
jgi:hypothetical protein